jgi:cytochrome c5
MKTLALMLALAAALAACGNQEGSSTSTASSSPPSSYGSSSTTAKPGTPAAPAPSGSTAADSTAAAPPAAVTADSTTNNPANSPAPTAAMGAGASGQDVYGKTCAVCHAAGVAGAPKLGDKADWGPRVAQGKDMLYDHALKGYTGKKGAMPPKGGNMALADADVKAAVDYMVSQAK